MENLLYEKMNIPSSCYVGNTIFKKHFYENATMSRQDKELFTDHINKILWKYSFKTDTINIQPFKDEEREYVEVALIEVQLEKNTKTKRIAEIIQKTIPYPLMIVFSYENQYLINVAYKRVNKNNDNKNIIEELIFTEGFNPTHQTERIQQFLNSMDIQGFSFNNFYRFYEDLVGKIYLFNASRYEGSILQDGTKTPLEIKQISDDIEKIEANLLDLKRKIKVEKHLNVKIDMNIKIKKLEAKKQELIQSLKG